eukprot:CAMPEP_0114276996 /NCGR_PEP_ID=MMETSP0059-20121206/545_1 /TAXON_ID=36894 /ORGANISM="Pyramimonas parkeae, Strain CCMP726" /LENGTH=292 /DNA_ID=CAMNT_0001397053 /DNA_START=159 /DNA_END=1037 /DNA_ORIENTATION=-
MEETILRQITFRCDLHSSEVDALCSVSGRAPGPHVIVWGADQHLPLGCENVHSDAAFESAQPDAGVTLKIKDSRLWANEDPGENLRFGLVWHGVRPLCEYLFREYMHGSHHPARVIELGAGMGVAGLFLAQLVGAPVLLTDGHPAVVKVLQQNAQLNHPACSNVTARRLWWGSEEIHALGNFHLVLATDVVYSACQVRPLLSTIKNLLSSTDNARAIMAHAARIDAGKQTDEHLSEMLRLATSEFGLTVDSVPFKPRSVEEKAVHITEFRHSQLPARVDAHVICKEPFLGLD